MSIHMLTPKDSQLLTLFNPNPFRCKALFRTQPVQRFAVQQAADARPEYGKWMLPYLGTAVLIQYIPLVLDPAERISVSGIHTKSQEDERHAAGYSTQAR
jgi:hypothetical protein